jgi:sec-independent protein translocase protein TatA
MFGIGMQELVVIFFIALLVFGASRLPEIGKSFGRAIKEFKKTSSEITDPDDNEADKK